MKSGRSDFRTLLAVSFDRALLGGTSFFGFVGSLFDFAGRAVESVGAGALSGGAGCFWMVEDLDFDAGARVVLVPGCGAATMATSL